MIGAEQKKKPSTIINHWLHHDHFYLSAVQLTAVGRLLAEIKGTKRGGAERESSRGDAS